MKKSIIALTIALFALTAIASPALAKNGHGQDKGFRGFGFGKSMWGWGHRIDDSKFVITGAIASKTASSVVVTVKTSVHVTTLADNLATVNVDTDTVIKRDKNETITLADINVGDQVIISGDISGTTLTGNKVHVIVPMKKAFGKVTAKTDTSVTVQNTITGTTQTVAVDADTKVKINGETKTIADVAVGDSGWVKFKNKAGVMVAKVINLFR